MEWNDATAKQPSWAAEIIAADQSGMYAGFFGHMDADQGKYGASARKQINKLLYAKLGTNDVRKKWWNPQETRIMKRMVTNKKNSSLKIMRNGQVTIFLCVLRKCS
ncbi:hypothetical protein [Phocaeicola vulgatus]|uniref:hypothetical protein n=1 Tax=Phocaeicola vulgatus TaxID=821 RepID=UPI00216699C5|nr:hypothetical protein [Phocaeicola vulgatus]